MAATIEYEFSPRATKKWLAYNDTKGSRIRVYLPALFLSSTDEDDFIHNLALIILVERACMESRINGQFTVRMCRQHDGYCACDKVATIAVRLLKKGNDNITILRNFLAYPRIPSRYKKK